MFCTDLASLSQILPSSLPNLFFICYCRFSTLEFLFDFYCHSCRFSLDFLNSVFHCVKHMNHSYFKTSIWWLWYLEFFLSVSSSSAFFYSLCDPLVSARSAGDSGERSTHLTGGPSEEKPVGIFWDSGWWQVPPERVFLSFQLQQTSLIQSKCALIINWISAFVGTGVFQVELYSDVALAGSVQTKTPFGKPNLHSLSWGNEQVSLLHRPLLTVQGQQ